MSDKRFAKFETFLESFFEFLKHEKGGWMVNTEDFYSEYIDYKFKQDECSGILADFATYLKMSRSTYYGVKAAYYRKRQDYVKNRSNSIERRVWENGTTYTVKEVANILKYKQTKSVYTLINSGKLNKININGDVRISADELNSFIQNRKGTPKVNINSKK